MTPILPTTARELVEAHLDARERTLLMVDDLVDEELAVPMEEILNPIFWEIGHVAWFQERWLVRGEEERPSRLPGADQLWNSSAVAHDTRWTIPIPDGASVHAYMQSVLEDVLERLETREPSPGELYFHRLAIFHEDMHGEALAMMRQELDRCSPPVPEVEVEDAHDCVNGDVELAGGRFVLGSHPKQGFVFDNEQWAHEQDVAPFAMSRVPVTQVQFRDFVQDGGYERDELWDADGLAWRRESDARCPRHWRRLDGEWQRGVFGCWRGLDERRPVVHVNAHEARAYCRWKNRRLPTELEWEFAACGGATQASVKPPKPSYPWGQSLPEPRHAHLDLVSSDVVSVDVHPDGDSPHGLRQMIGNVWEWTSSPFQPYPGFEPGPYRDYSQPWFGNHLVMRGGSFVTRRRLIRNSWRNFYKPHRQDPFVGFRTARDLEA